MNVKRLLPEDAISILESGDFSGLIGVVESEELEFKTIYELKDERTKAELLKDVAAFGNAKGGIIVVGVSVRKVLNEDVSDKLVPFGPEDLDLDRVEKIITEGLQPPARIRTKLYKSASGCLAYIRVEANRDNWPHILTKAEKINDEGQTIYFALPQRGRAQTNWIKAPQLQSWIQQGKSFDRLQASYVEIANSLTDLRSAVDLIRETVQGEREQRQPKPDIASVTSRLHSAQRLMHPEPDPVQQAAFDALRREAIAVGGFGTRPNLLLAAYPETSVEMEGLFDRSSDLRNELENAKSYLDDDWQVWPSAPWENVHGRLVRSGGERHVAMLSRSGVFLLLQSGGPDFLCYGWGSGSSLGFRIQPFLLAYTTFEFLRRTAAVWRFGRPAVKRVRYRLELRNMVDEGVLPFFHPRHGPRSLISDHAWKQAPHDNLAVSKVESAHQEPGVVAFELVAEISRLFGFDDDDLMWSRKTDEGRRVIDEVSLRPNT